MMIMLTCSSRFWRFDHDRHRHGDGDRAGMAIMIKAEAEDTTVGIKGIPLNAAKTAKGRFRMKLK
jgi:hypothetical protein